MGKSLIKNLASIRLNLSTSQTSLPRPQLTRGGQATVRNISETSVILSTTHFRDACLAGTLHLSFAYYPGGSDWPATIFEDQQSGEHSAIAGVISHFHQTTKCCNITFVELAHANCYFDLPMAGAILPFVDIRAYRRISKDYFRSLRRVFSPHAGQRFREDVQRVAIFEDDMDIAPDFISYFITLIPFLDSNHDLYFISAQNDHGILSLSLNEPCLHRTDFSPGLGWMLIRRLWSGILLKWPDFFSANWMRHLDQSRNRHCIRPEASRTANSERRVCRNHSIIQTMFP